MSEKQYIVTLVKGIDVGQFNQEMVSAFGSETIPARPIDVADAMPLSRRNTIYMLSDEEAALLRLDSRVVAIELPFDDDETLMIEPDIIQTGRFDKFVVPGFADYTNWGLRRVVEKDNALWPNWHGDDLGPNGANGILPSDDNHRYVLDGTGVDVVIQDTGVHLTHPEFNDADGNSRVVEYDWYSTPGVTGSLPNNYYSATRLDNHGTHCASIVAGKQYGWAKNAAIYDLTNITSSWKIDPLVSFQLLRAWHNNKSVDANLGVKRPTVVNASWSYSRSYNFSDVTSITYRGSTYTGTAINTQAKRAALGFVDPFAQGATTNRRFNSFSSAVQAEIEDAIDDGIHYITSAGNRSFKVDLDGGQDHDNSVVVSGVTYFYNRGKGPGGAALGTTTSQKETLSKVIVVGNIDRDVDKSNNKEQKNESSETGPGVDIYAPGTKIAAGFASNNINAWPYPPNTTFKSGVYSGTSQAAPQVAGVLAMMLQINPQATPEQAKAWIMNNAINGEISEPSHDPANYRSLLGGAGKYLYSPINSDTVLNISTKAV